MECDENIRAKDEVLIVNEEDKLLAYGKALLGAWNQRFPNRTG